VRSRELAGIFLATIVNLAAISQRYSKLSNPIDGACKVKRHLVSLLELRFAEKDGR
jgi:hypothetical protein